MKLRSAAVAHAARPFVKSKNCVFTMFNRLAELHSAINLGAGTPSGLPPFFVTEAFRRYAAARRSEHHTSAASVLSDAKSRTKPTLPLNDTIASIYSQKLDLELSANRNVLVTSGAREALHATLNALLAEGDEAIVFDPSYEIYREAIRSVKATAVGVPLTPRKKVPTGLIKCSKLDLLRREDPFRSCVQDSWDVNFDRLAKSITRKTKAIILNSPHNPSGKIFSERELSLLRDILRQHKQITVIDDRVYQHTQFDAFYEKEVPRISSSPDMFNRTVTIFSGGKLLRTNDLVCGWVIAPEGLRNRIAARSCIKPLTEEVTFVVGESLNAIYNQQNNHYLTQFSSELVRKRRLLLQQLINSKYDFNLWVPSAGFFVLADISAIDIDEKHYSSEAGRLPKDYAFCMKLCKEDGVAAIPCSSFFEHGSNQNLVRFAFCKDEMSIMEAGRRLRETEKQDVEESHMELCPVAS